MKNLKILASAILIIMAVNGVKAQVITGSSLFSPSAGGARILSAQGNTAANPAIGFQSAVSTPATAQNDGGGGNGIFRPLANTMAFSTASTERMRINSGGFVGIGTANPVQNFHLNGNGYVENGSLTIGISAASNTFSKFQVHNGAMMVSGANGAGGAMVVFSDNVAPTAYPNGRWGIEYVPNTGLNFWKPWNPSTGGGGNYFMLLKDDGKIGMGIDPASCTNAFAGGYRLYVKDGILTEKVKVANYCASNWADYVFDAAYKLRPLSEVEAFVKENKHLPNVPSALEIEKEGLDLADMQAKQMEKIEELTLYMIEMKKEIEILKKENQVLRSSIVSPSK